jgi:glycosyltransferase involved in cell wall biosynthesis
MLERDYSVVFVAADADACALWRLYMPHVAMPGSSFFHFAQRPDFEKIAGHDVIVVQRCCTNAQFELIRACKQLGMLVVYDLDDAIWTIPEYNPAAAVLGKYREGFNACIRLCDVCTVSTKVLAKVVRKHVGGKLLCTACMGKNPECTQCAGHGWVGGLTSQWTGKEIPIVVCENRIEERLFASPAFPDARLVVGWAGSSSHIGDLKLIEKAIVNCAKENPETVFEYRGCQVEENNPVRKLKNWRHQLWTPVAEYAARMPMWGWSIALAPVTDHEFNSSKSAIKAVEAGYCGIPCLMSHVEPYDNFCHHEPELQWLLCAGASAFEAKLRILINEPERREHLGLLMRDVVARHYSYRRRHEAWDRVFGMTRELVKGMRV